MSTSYITISKAMQPDLKVLQKLAVKTFSETFGPANTKQNLEHYLATGFTLEKITNEVNNPESEFYFSHLNDVPMGYLKINYGKAQTDILMKYIL